jgi:hypothetical protein
MGCAPSNGWIDSSGTDWMTAMLESSVGDDTVVL